MYTQQPLANDPLEVLFLNSANDFLNTFLSGNQERVCYLNYFPPTSRAERKTRRQRVRKNKPINGLHTYKQRPATRERVVGAPTWKHDISCTRRNILKSHVKAHRFFEVVPGDRDDIAPRVAEPGSRLFHPSKRPLCGGSSGGGSWHDEAGTLNQQEHNKRNENRVVAHGRSRSSSNLTMRLSGCGCHLHLQKGFEGVLRTNPSLSFSYYCLFSVVSLCGQSLRFREPRARWFSFQNTHTPKQFPHDKKQAATASAATPSHATGERVNHAGPDGMAADLGFRV